MMASDSVSENLRQIRQSIAQLNLSREVSIVGVTKFQSVEKIIEATQSGLEILAVNYAQEGEQLRDALKDPKLAWHFIGHIQSRKVKFLPAYNCIQSIDRFEIAEALNLRMSSLNRKIDVMVEVNIGDEPQKSGVSVELLDSFLERISTLGNIRLIGMMTMPPATPVVEARRPYFQRMNQLFQELNVKYPMKTLSMGTSEDYLLAIEEGANMVRLGTILFGSRASLNELHQGF